MAGVMVQFESELSPGAAAEWEAFWSACRYAHPEQHPLYAHVIRGRGRVPIFVTGRAEGRIVCTALLGLKPRLPHGRCSLDALCARGPVFEDIAAGCAVLQSVVDWCRARLVGSLVIQPNWPFPDAGPLDALLPSLGFSSGTREHTGILSLRASDEQLLASLSQGTRSHLRRARRWGAVIRPVQCADEADAFFRRYAEMSRSRGLPADSPSELRAKFDIILRHGRVGILLCAFLSGHFVGGLALIRSRTIAYAHRYVVVPERLGNLRIGALLWWEGMQWAKQQGAAWFDVSGYRADSTPGSEIYEIYRFKAGFRPSVVEKLPCIRCACNRALFQLSRIRNRIACGLRSGVRIGERLRRVPAAAFQSGHTGHA